MVDDVVGKDHRREDRVAADETGAEGVGRGGGVGRLRTPYHHVMIRADYRIAADLAPIDAGRLDTAREAQCQHSLEA